MSGGCRWGGCGTGRCGLFRSSVGTRIWQLIEEKGQLQAIVDTLLQEYEVEEERLLTDLEALLTEVSEKGLVTLQAGDTAT